MNLSPRQAEVLAVIQAFIHNKKYPPSIHDLCQLCGVTSTSTIHFHLEALRRKGFVNWIPAGRRTLHVLKGLEET